MSASQPEPRALGRRPEADDRLVLICALASGAGLIHVLAAVEHVQEYALYAVFFALLAPAQVAWSIVVYRTGSRRLLVMGAIGMLLIVVLWTFSRTTGLPIGPSPGTPESFGTLDVAATADELVLVGLIFARLWPPSSSAFRVFERLAASLAVVLLLATSLVLVGPGHTH
jgi:hypothetical protein